MSLSIARIIYAQVHDGSKDVNKRIEAVKRIFPLRLWSPEQVGNFIRAFEVKQQATRILNPVVCPPILSVSEEADLLESHSGLLWHHQYRSQL